MLFLTDKPHLLATDHYIFDMKITENKRTNLNSKLMSLYSFSNYVSISFYQREL
jgi:hypothetical protein